MPAARAVSVLPFAARTTYEFQWLAALHALESFGRCGAHAGRRGAKRVVAGTRTGTRTWALATGAAGTRRTGTRGTGTTSGTRGTALLATLATLAGLLRLLARLFVRVRRVRVIHLELLGCSAS